MATRADFSGAEWQMLRETPHRLVIATAAAGHSGFVGSLKEALAPAGGIIEALKGANGLLHEVCDHAEVEAAVAALREQEQGADFGTVQARFREDAIEGSRAAVELLLAKGASQDAEAYAAFLTRLAHRVAIAAKEGAFLGFGGERISAPERALLAELERAVSATFTGA